MLTIIGSLGGLVVETVEGIELQRREVAALDGTRVDRTPSWLRKRTTQRRDSEFSGKNNGRTAGAQTYTARLFHGFSIRNCFDSMRQSR